MAAVRSYLLTYVALLLLSGLTLGLSFVGLGPWSYLSALSIALVKSTLVALSFMHLASHGRSACVAFLVSVTLALCLFGFAMLDVSSRVPPFAAASHALP